MPSSAKYDYALSLAGSYAIMADMADTTLWGIHAGKTGDADTLFKNKNLVALGWSDVDTDLSKVEGTREKFKALYAAAYPHKKDAAVPVSAGQLYRFVHEVRRGDHVAYPSKRDRQVHIGRIEGEYQYRPEVDKAYPHQRPVKWLREVPRTHFTQGALYELGSAMSLFQIKNYSDEYFAALEGSSTPPSAEDDETVALVAEEIEQTTEDYVLKMLAQELKGHPFAQFVAHLLSTMGYRTRVSPPGPDGGIDVLAHRDELGFEPPIIKVQVKATEGSVGAPVVQALYGNVGNSEFGLLVTLGSFTTQANAFAQGKSNLRLIDGEELVGLVLSHYEQFDSRYKGILPLKRVYVPEKLSQEVS